MGSLIIYSLRGIVARNWWIVQRVIWKLRPPDIRVSVTLLSRGLGHLKCAIRVVIAWFTILSAVGTKNGKPCYYVLIAHFWNIGFLMVQKLKPKTTSVEYFRARDLTSVGIFQWRCRTRAIWHVLMTKTWPSLDTHVPADLVADTMITLDPWLL